MTRTMSETRAVRYHVLSIRDNLQDEQLIENIWGSDPEIEIAHVVVRKYSGVLRNLLLQAIFVM